MATLCPDCATPAVAGHRFCGHCGALVVRGGASSPAPAGPPVDPGPQPTPRVLLPGWDVDGEHIVQRVEVAGAADDPGREAAPTARRSPRPASRDRRPTAIAAVAVLLLVVGLGRASGGPIGGADAATSGVPALGNANARDVAVPRLGSSEAWHLTARDRDTPLAPLPWPAPLVSDERIVAVVPGAVVLHDRATEAVRRVELPTSGATAPVVLEDGTIVVVGGADGWWVTSDGVVARTTTGDLADVTPVRVGPAAVIFQGALGGLRRVELRPDGTLEVTALRGIDVIDRDAAPRFSLAAHAVDRGLLWVGGRDRGSDEIALWLLDAGDLAPVGRIELATTSLPTLAAAPGGVVVAHDDRVAAHGRDLRLFWEVRPGAGAEVLGVDDGRVLVRHDAGRVVLAADRDGAAVARATLALLAGPRSVVAGGEVLVSDGERIQALRIADATVSRRLEGVPLSIPGQDDDTIAWVTRGADGAVVLRVQPASDRTDGRGALDAVDLPLPVDAGCRVVGAGDRLAWHDGTDLRELRLDGSVRGRVESPATRRSMLAIDQEGRVHVVDPRGVVRRFAPGLRDFDVLAIGDDPVGGLALDGDLVVVAGGTGRVAVVGASDGYLRGVTRGGATRWLARIREAVASAPVGRDGTAAVRQVDGSVSVVRDGVFVAQVPADARSLDPPTLDGRGLLLRDGAAVAAVFPQGDPAWATPDVATLPGLAVARDVVVARGVAGLVGLDRATGSVLWRVAVVDGAGRSTSPLSPATIAGDTVVVAVHDGLVTHDLRTGQETGRARTTATLAGPIVPTTRGVVACLASGDLALFA